MMAPPGQARWTPVGRAVGESRAEDMAERKTKVQTDGVTYPIVACPGCNATDNVVAQNGGTNSTKLPYRIRLCRTCGMHFKEPVPAAGLRP